MVKEYCIEKDMFDASCERSEGVSLLTRKVKAKALRQKPSVPIQGSSTILVVFMFFTKNESETQKFYDLAEDHTFCG